MSDIPDKPWSEIIAPIVQRFDLAATFGQTACWNAEGSRACAAIWKEMARLLDEEGAFRRVLADLLRPLAPLHRAPLAGGVRRSVLLLAAMVAAGENPAR